MRGADGKLVLTLPAFQDIDPDTQGKPKEPLKLTDAEGNSYGKLEFLGEIPLTYATFESVRPISNKLTLYENAANLEEIKLSNMMTRVKWSDDIGDFMGVGLSLFIEGTVSAQYTFSEFPEGAGISYNEKFYRSNEKGTALTLGGDVINLSKGSIFASAGIVLQTKGGKVATGSDDGLQITADGGISSIREHDGRTFSTYDKNGTKTAYSVAGDGSCLYAEKAGKIVCYSDQNACPNSVTAKEGEDIVGNSLSPTPVTGSVSLNEGESFFSYTASVDGTTIDCGNDGIARLTAGAVSLDKGESIYASGAGYKVTLVEGGSCTVAADGSITGLAGGTHLTVVQSGKEYDCLVSGGEFEVTKDSVTKSCSLSDGSVAGSALEKVLDDVLEEWSNLDPSKPQTIKTTPGETKTPEKFDPKKDTIRISQASGALDADKLILTEDGQLTYGDSLADGLENNGVVDLSKGEQGKKYYTARLTDEDGKNEQLVAWSGTQSATVDMRQESKGVIMKDGGNGTEDTFLGGRGNDNITLGRDDVAAGGKGDDDITMGADASGAEVVFKDGDGHDKVKDFRFGFGEDANVVSLPGGQGIFGINVDSRGRLQVGDATLDFTGTNLATSEQTDLLLKDANGTHKAAIGTHLTAGEEPADFYYGIGKDVEVDFSGIQDDLVIDLSNSNALGDSATYSNVSKARAGEGSVVMVGSKKTATILQAGSGGSSLWGGSRDSDSLWDDEKIAFSSDGEHVSYGKVGRSGQISEFTYSDDVGAYVGGKAGSSLTVAGSEDALVWLDGAAGVGYSNISRVDGSGSTGNLIIGGTSSKDVILGGSGSNTLWGGAGDDTLTGGTGYNEFYFGKGEGCDIITSSNNGDKVMLYNVAREDLDLSRTGMDSKGSMVICLTDGSGITIRNYSEQGAAVFQLSDSTWHYDRESGAWSQE